MLQKVLKIGKALNKAEQKELNGGFYNTECGSFPGTYYVSNCNQCENTIIPGGPVACRNNCCLQAF